MKRPHIILCFTDQQKATSLDLYQTVASAARARNLERLAREGTLFEAAYCTYPLCLPSRIAMMTGRYPSASGYVGNGPWLEPDADSLPDRLHEAGYRCYLAGKDHCFCHPHSSGGEQAPEELRTRYDRSFLALHNEVQPREVCEALPDLVPYLRNTAPLHTIWGASEAPWPSSHSLTKLLTDQALGFMEEHLAGHPGEPFFLHWGPPDPHEFYQAPGDVLSRFPLEDIVLPPNVEADLSDRAEFVQYMGWYFNHGSRRPAREDLAQLYRVYLAMCQLVDDQLGRLVDYVQARGLWEDTIWVFSSDHGDMAGELGLAHKWNGLYDGMVRVPLVVAAPGRAGCLAGQRRADPVSLVDLAATLCEFAQSPPPSGNQGESLCGLMRGEGSRRYAFLESGLAGEGMTLRDTANFPGHDWQRPTRDAAPYDPPHRWTGRCLGVRDARHKLIVREGQASELYDMVADPWEMHNRIGDPGLAADRARLERALLEHSLRLQTNTRGSWGDKHMDPFYTPGQSQPWDRPIHQPW